MSIDRPLVTRKLTLILAHLKLAELEILERDFARQLAPSAGLRNRLVHEYEEIDPEKVFDALTRAEPDVIAYAQAIEMYRLRGGEEPDAGQNRVD